MMPCTVLLIVVNVDAQNYLVRFRLKTAWLGCDNKTAWLGLGSLLY